MSRNSSRPPEPRVVLDKTGTRSGIRTRLVREQGELIDQLEKLSVQQSRCVREENGHQLTAIVGRQTTLMARLEAVQVALAGSKTDSEEDRGALAVAMDNEERLRRLAHRINGDLRVAEIKRRGAAAALQTVHAFTLALEAYGNAQPAAGRVDVTHGGQQ